MKHSPSSFRDAELAVQRRADVPMSHTQMASDFIRRAMPMQHREFFESLPVLFMGFLDGNGRVWASPAMGKPGFVRTPAANKITIDAQPALAEQLGLDLSENSKVGIVGIELHTRRRNRANGTVAAVHSGGFEIKVDQSFGNCPQYIQARYPEWDDHNLDGIAASKADGLTAEVRAIIEKADTFIIASRSHAISNDPREGVDASHRGGRPGFLGINDDGSLSFPDFSGNRFFNTLGNIEDDGRVGLFIPNFDDGSAVFVTGRATVDWDEARVGSFEGAERIIDIQPDEIWHATGVFPNKTEFLQEWPLLANTGTWEDAKIAALSTDGYRGYRITAKEQESDVITSFYLSPADKGALPPHTAGQFLPIRLQGADGPVLRSYTISQGPNGHNLRLSVKREDQGVGSRILHDQLNIGDVFEAATPAGDFVLDDSDQPIVFLSAGVGITPMIAMLDGQVEAVRNGAKPRDIWFVHAAMNGKTRAFDTYLRELAQKYTWLKLFTVFSHPTEADQLGSTHDAEGFLSVDTLSGLLPFGAYQFYMCGPEGFMRALYTGLRNIGIDKSHIHYEFFGAGTLDDEEEDTAAPKIDMPDEAPILFAKTGGTETWTPEDGTLLEFAEKQGLTPTHNCRDGKCGACAVNIREGSVNYTTEPLVPVAEGQALICCSVPSSEEGVTLDL